MRKDGTWAMEVKILVTAKCFRRDIFTYYKDKWECHSYLTEFSEDAINLMRKITSNLFRDCNKFRAITTVQKVIHFIVFNRMSLCDLLDKTYSCLSIWKYYSYKNDYKK